MSGADLENNFSVAIVGADSAALTTALACHAAGFADITLYNVESSSSALSQRATSVELSPNASRILRTLRVLDRLTADCFEPQFIHQRSYRTGFQLSIQALGAMAEGRYHAPFLHIENDRLCETLKKIAQQRGVIFSEKKIRGLSQGSNRIDIDLGSTATKPHNVIIVASDPTDRIRALTNAEPISRNSTNLWHWQSSVAKQRLPAGAFGPVITQWLGPHHHLSYHFGADGQHLHLNAITALPAESDVLPAQLEQSFGGWHSSLQALVTAAENLRFERVEQSVSPQRLAHGRIVFLAASCHRVLPHLPQQAALGIEDAWVVARMLEQWEEEPAGGWVEYEKYRLPRARRMQEQAERRAQELCEPNPSKAWARNLGLSLSSRFLPELAMQKNDWLYGYDAVNGFE